MLTISIIIGPVVTTWKRRTQIVNIQAPKERTRRVSGGVSAHSSSLTTYYPRKFNEYNSTDFE